MALWNVYNRSWNRLGVVRCKTGKAALARAKNKFGSTVSGVLPRPNAAWWKEIKATPEGKKFAESMGK